MCQAYAAERNWVVTIEGNATIKGFVAARAGKPKRANPYDGFSSDYKKAWDHGWGCWHSKKPILPYELECKLPLGERTSARLRFEKTRELPEVIIDTVEYWNRVAEADVVSRRTQ